MRWINWMALVVVIGIFGAGCGKKTSHPTTETEIPVVYTTFYPTKYFAERIGGKLIDVVCPVPADKDAISWMPQPKEIQAYQKADMIILNGAEFAKWVHRVSLPDRRVINTAATLKNEFITFQHSTVHSHGQSGEHAHEGLDGHTWVDPVNAKIQAESIRDALITFFPEHAETFGQGFATLANDLNSLDKRLKAYQADYKNQPLLASHPAYNYIARRYGWNVHNLDLDPEKMPSDEVIRQIKIILTTHPAKHLIWETNPTKAIADRMQKELGLASIQFSPCELLSDKELSAGKTYMTVMRENITNMGVIFGHAESSPRAM